MLRSEENSLDVAEQFLPILPALMPVAKVISLMNDIVNYLPAFNIYLITEVQRGNANFLNYNCSQ